MVRLFVGGLTQGITVEQLSGRFTPFGAVSACDLIPNKALAFGDDSAASKGFAYVDLDPKDEQQLDRCLSLVSTCTCPTCTGLSKRTP